MRVQTNNDSTANFIKIDPGETLVIEFNPDGFNAALGSTKALSFTVGTMFTPDGRMGLSISLPEDRAYKIGGENHQIILCDIAGYEKLAFNSGDGMDLIVELEKV